MSETYPMTGGNALHTYPMTGGNALHSYTNNSTRQKEAADGAKSMLIEGIIENLDIKNVLPSTKFTIADFGCSTGPNTFISVNNIIEGVTKAYKINSNSDKNLPEFQVFFNDHISNDFNTLFANLPSNRKYYCAAFPGSFHKRLFARSSLNFAYSAFALHWLSRVPRQLSDLSSPICNNGRIHYVNAGDEICEAYSSQFAMDIETFLSVREEELVPGGLMAVLVPARPNGTLPSQFSIGKLFLPVESCLLDMANEGILSRDEIDSFNLPMYNPSIEEITRIIKKNGKFSIAKLEETPNGKSEIKMLTTREIRAGLETILKAYFGSEIAEEIFHRYDAKFSKLFSTTNIDDFAIDLFILLRKYL